MKILTVLTLYCAAILASSLLGGWLLPALVRASHRATQVLMSLIAGLMLGVGLLHMLPHAIVKLQSANAEHAVDTAFLWAMAGVLFMVFMLRAFHFHHHEQVVNPKGDHPHGPGECESADHSHAHAPHALSWMGIALGLALHTILDGVALAASVKAEANGEWGLFGLGVFAAIVLHKPLDAMAITSLMEAGGWSPSKRHAVNLMFGLMCPVGVALFYLGLSSASGNQDLVVGYALAFSAGIFLCIALSDLLPEIQFHRHDRLVLSASLLAGVAAAYAIGFLEHAGHGHHVPGPVHDSHEKTRAGE